MMWLWICGKAPKLSGSGMVYFCLRRTRSSSLFRKISRMDFWYCPITQSSATNVPIYHPDDEGGIAYNTPDIGVEWPIPEGMELILSEKDTKWGTLEQYMKEKSMKKV